jgi:NitT/TauT family transport system substrate-binding protein
MTHSLLTRITCPLAVTAIAATVATSVQAGTLSIDHTTWVGYGTLHLAQDLGYFKENGLTVELPGVEEAEMYMAAQASGELSGSTSTIDEVLKYRSQFCFKAVAALDDSHGGDGVRGLFTDQLFRFLRLRITTWAQ